MQHPLHDPKVYVCVELQLLTNICYNNEEESYQVMVQVHSVRIFV